MQPVWIDREGKQSGALGPPGEYRNLALSPDGNRVVIDRYDMRTRGRDLWLYELSRGTASRITFDPADDSDTDWSPDGQHIAFGSNRGGSAGLYQKVATGAGEEEMVTKVTTATLYPRDWSSDGRFIIFSTIAPVTQSDLWVVPLFGDRKLTPYLQTEFGEGEG